MNKFIFLAARNIFAARSTQHAVRKDIFPVLRSAFCVLLLSLLMVACKTTGKVGTVETGVAKAHADFFDSMKEQAFQYQTLSARTNVDLDIPGNSLSSRVDIKMVRDSAFQLSVQPFLGIEVARVEFNRDSVKVIDRMNKRYVAESYARLKGTLPVTFNFYNLQALFTNHLFIPGEQEVSAGQYKRFALKQGGSVAEARIKDDMDLLYTFTADGEEKLLSTYVTDKAERYALQWLYSDFRLTEKQPFPMLMDVKLLDEGTSAGGMKLHFTKIQTNVPLKIESSIPDKYKRITFAELIKGLSGSKK